MNDPLDELRGLLILLPFAVIGFVGGVVNQLYQHTRKDEPLSFARLFFNGVIAAFVSSMANGIVPSDWDAYRVPIAGFTGFMAYPILAVLEAQGVDFIKKRFGVK